MTPSRISLAMLYAFTAASIAGFAIFGLHPERLAAYGPQTIQFYAMSFRFFALGQVILAGAVMLGFLAQHARSTWLISFVALYAISLTMELLGTTYGVPFGRYAYSSVLNPMWFGRVPVGIPLSWFYMAVPSYAIARAALPKNTLSRIVLGSFILLAWDLPLDPAMSNATKFWEWGEKGSYYGMPLLNLVGWYVTGLALMCALSALSADSWISRLPQRWLAGFYGANLLLGVGLSLAAGLWLVLPLTLAALTMALVTARILRRPASANTLTPLATKFGDARR